MNANLLLERWRIGKRIESGGYLDNKFTVAESLSFSSYRFVTSIHAPAACGHLKAFALP
jgi:hypothetical protein